MDHKMALVEDPLRFWLGLALFLLPGAAASYRFLAGFHITARLVAVPVLSFTVVPFVLLVLHLLLFVPLTMETFAMLSATLTVLLIAVGPPQKVFSVQGDDLDEMSTP